MKSKGLVAGFILILILGLLGYRMFAGKSIPAVKQPVSALPSPAVVEQKAAVDDLQPRVSPVEAPSTTASDSSGVEDISKVRGSAEYTPGSTVIEAKAPKGAEPRASIVSLVADERTISPEKERLENVAQSYAEGKDAVQVFGDQLNAINGTYTGELVREGKDSCPFSLVVDGMYLPGEGSTAAKFDGNFSVSYECSNGFRSKFQFDNEFGSAVRAIGEESKSLLLRDTGGSFFQISFSNDFHRVMGNVYDTASGESPVFIGKMSAQR
ncbi:MAG: hypothetical protein EOP04_01020 [Proteobacteria bacterium]|nr:MAG: hypothetical protein EOP04_01020 [Pseudomonadota bacterium]